MNTPFSAEPARRGATGTIPLSEPNISGREWEYVKECLDTGWVSSVGSFVDRFEREFAEAVGSNHAVAMVNGTSALHIALLVAGVKTGDEVLLPALTFIAPANAIRYAGAWPIFIDVDAQFAQLDASRLRSFLTEECERVRGRVVNRQTGRPVSAVLAVDILGHPCDLDAIHAVASEFDLTVVEDATESLGAKHSGRRLGSVSPVTAFSFNGNKLLTTGGGGMLVTNDAGTADQARYLSTQAKDDPIEFVHGRVGFNYRLTNVQAAIGCAQLERLAEFVATKRRIADRYRSELSDVAGIRLPAEAPWAASSWWLYTVRIDPAIFGCDSRALIRYLSDRGIQTRPLWQPLHMSPALADSPKAACPVAEAWYRDAVSLPCSTGLSDAQQGQVIEALRSAHVGESP